MEEELNIIKEEVETVSRRLAELSEEELNHVNGAGWSTTGCIALIIR